ncbi:MAG: PilZ domain-containing protein [Lachnospiraceae bacterium]|nr:PilZ domain-containing protein [Lachnospiraceae bacterium]
MLLENIPMGKTLEFYIDREGYRYRLVSKVEKAEEDKVYVTLIASNGRAFRFRPEDDIRIIYRDEDQIWEWPEVKAGVEKLEYEDVHVFHITDKGHSFNRRNSYRVTLGEETLIGYYNVPGRQRRSAVPPAPTEDEMGMEVLPDVKPQYVRGVIKDVSETGVGLFTDYEFDTEDGLFFDIPSSRGLLKCKAQVIRKDELRATNYRYDYYYGCVLTQTDKKLLRYIFEVQREALKRQRGQ